MACDGVVLDAPRGPDGFGYDPLFQVPKIGLTLAELGGIGTKGEISHRARAMHAITPQLLVSRGARSGGRGSERP